jgi:SAM-dependent methyltransferase
MSEWVDYYRALENRQPRKLFQDWKRIWEASREEPGFAIDLGCGDGTETLALLALGWRVLAIDSTPEAIELVTRRTPEEDRPLLRVKATAFQLAHFPPANLIYAGLSLPFCSPEDFPVVWRKIRAALKPGGRFVGHLFGVRDSWADKPHMNFLTVDKARALFDGLTVERFQEFELDESTVFEPVKRKHYFEVIAKRDSEAAG